MIKLADFRIASLQATLFTPELPFNQQSILKHFLEKWSEIFDGTPISVPVPDNIDPRLPRVILESSDKNYKIEFSPARVNFFWLLKKEDDKYTLEEFFGFANNLLCDYHDFINWKVGRIAAVANRFLRDDDPAKILVNKFCQDTWVKEPFNNLENFEIHSHKRYEQDCFSINSWVRFKTGFIGSKSKENKVLTVEQDINTLTEDLSTNDFSNDEIKKFYGLVINEFDQILSLFI